MKSPFRGLNLRLITIILTAFCYSCKKTSPVPPAGFERTAETDSSGVILAAIKCHYWVSALRNESFLYVNNKLSVWDQFHERYNLTFHQKGALQKVDQYKKFFNQSVTYKLNYLENGDLSHTLIEIKDPFLIKVDTLFYTFDSGKRVLAIHRGYQGTHDRRQVETITYDGNGNISILKKYNSISQAVYDSVAYFYTNKKNPLLNSRISVFPGSMIIPVEFFNANHISKIEQKMDDSYWVRFKTTTYRSRFNKFDFPVSAVIDDGNSYNLSDSIEYIYQLK